MPATLTTGLDAAVHEEEVTREKHLSRPRHHARHYLSQFRPKICKIIRAITVMMPYLKRSKIEEATPSSLFAALWRTQLPEIKLSNAPMIKNGLESARKKC